MLARTDKFVSFERAVHIVRGSQVIDARQRARRVSPRDEEHLTSLELQGSARIETPNAEPGELKLMSGDVINLTYYENTDVLQSAIVTGGAALRIAAEKDAAESVLHADNIEIGMAPDGTTLTSLNARDHVVFDLSTAKGQPAKKVTSNALVASGSRGKGADRRVVHRRRRVSGDGRNAAGEAHGHVADARYVAEGRPRSDSGSHVHRLGAAARREDSATQAAGSTMRYNMETGQVSLTGATGEPVPRVVNEQIQIDATNIDMNVEGSKMKAYGESRRVQSIMFPAKPGAKRRPAHAGPDEAGSAGATASAASSSIRVARTARSSSRAPSCSCRARRARRRSRATRFRSTARPAIFVAQGSVISQMVVQDINPTTKERETTRSTGYGQQMQYDDALRKVTYTTKAHLVGPQGDLTGETIVLTLGAERPGHRAARSVRRRQDDGSRSHHARRSAHLRCRERGIQRRRQREAGADVQARQRRDAVAAKAVF